MSIKKLIFATTLSMVALSGVADAQRNTQTTNRDGSKTTVAENNKNFGEKGSRNGNRSASRGSTSAGLADARAKKHDANVRMGLALGYQDQAMYDDAYEDWVDAVQAENALMARQYTTKPQRKQSQRNCSDVCSRDIDDKGGDNWGGRGWEGGSN